jgi:hypothetical protein
MTTPLDGKDSLFYPGMRRWDGRTRVTNNWNTLNNVRVAVAHLSWMNGLLTVLGLRIMLSQR